LRLEGATGTTGGDGRGSPGTGFNRATGGGEVGTDGLDLSRGTQNRTITSIKHKGIQFTVVHRPSGMWITASVFNMRHAHG
jgi:hypothetical protein